MGWPTGINIDGSTGRPTDLNYTGANPTAYISNTILGGNSTPFIYTASTSQMTGWSTADLTTYFSRTGANNSLFFTTNEIGLVAPFKYDSAIDFNPSVGSPAATGGSFSNARLTNNFFTSTTFRGAAGVNDNWWKGWAKFN